MRTARLLTLCAALCVAVVAPGSAAGATSQPHAPAVPDRGRQPLIFGGTPLASSTQAPWSVLLQRLSTTGFQTYCSANIIAPTVVLTAAHCVTDEVVKGSPPVQVAAANYQIQAGGTAENQPGAQVIGVAGIAVHPYFRNINLGDDVAVLVLASPLAINANTAPIALPKPKSYVRAGKSLSFFGWGTTEAQAPQGLRGMTTTALAPSICAGGIPGVQCVYNPTVAPCPGDSGGGLIRTTKAGTPELIGLDSYGPLYPEGQPICQSGTIGDGYSDLTQPELLNFIGAVLSGRPATPPRGPRAKRRPTVKVIGSYTLRCSSAGWSGKPKRTTVFALENNRKVLQSGRRTTFTVTRKLRRRFIFCASLASNSGGRAGIESKNKIATRR